MDTTQTSGPNYLMKILVLTSTYSRWKGDTEPKFVDNLCAQLATTNEVHVLAPHAKALPKQESLDQIRLTRFRYAPERFETLAYDGGILPNIREQPARLLLAPGFLLGQIWAIRKLLNSAHYDVIHAHWLIPQGLAAVMARLLCNKNTPLVITSHGGDMFALKGALFSRLKRWILRQAAHTTVVSSAMRDKAIELAVPVERLEIIPMGVDTRADFTPPAEGTPRRGLVFVGRLVEKKGVEYLLEAMPAILQAHPQEKLTIVGDGPLRSELEALSGRLGVQSSVRFVGSVPNEQVEAYFQTAAIAVIPSVIAQSGDQEGAPVAIMETLACACAAVVADFPGARDIIADGENGLLVPMRDSQAIVGKVSLLLDNPSLGERLGQAGRDTIVNGFDWAAIGAKFQTVFQDCVSRQDSVKTSVT